MRPLTLVTNLTIAAALVGLGALHGGLGPDATTAVLLNPDRPAEQTVAAASVAGRNLLLVEGFESNLPFEVGEGLAASYGPPSAGSGAYWGRSVARALSGLFSAWCAGAGPSSPAEPPYGANCTPDPPSSPSPCQVPPGTNTTLTAGPYNLTGYTTGQLSLEVWLDTTPVDPFSVQASLDGTQFHGYTYYGVGSGPMVFSLLAWPSLGDLAGQPQVWFRFGYASSPYGLSEGAYLDNIRLEVSAADLVFADSFELGDASAWSFTLPSS